MDRNSKSPRYSDKIVGSRNVISAIRIAINNEILAKQVFYGQSNYGLTVL